MQGTSPPISTVYIIHVVGNLIFMSRAFHGIIVGTNDNMLLRYVFFNALMCSTCRLSPCSRHFHCNSQKASLIGEEDYLDLLLVPYQRIPL